VQSLGETSVCYRDAWESAYPLDPGYTFSPSNPLVTGGFSLDLWCQNQVAHSLGHGAPTLFNICPEEGQSIGP
jgi:hypothetical protein